MTEQLTPAASISPLRRSTADSQLFSCNSLSFTLLSKNVPANHLESHSCKNKGLKVPCFHTLTKNIGGRGSGPGLRAIDARHRNRCPARKMGVLSNLQPHTSNLRSSLTPLDSALTSKRPAKSFTSNTYEKHTQGEGSLVAQASVCVCRCSVGPGFPVRILHQPLLPLLPPMPYNLPHSTGAKENHR
jgi:hypothetical protein